MPEQEHDEQDVDTDLDEGQEGDEQDEAGEGEEWTPPTQQDWDNVQEALRKARRDARAARRKPAGKGGDDTDPDKVREQAESAAEAKYRPMVVRSAARSTFTAAGLALPDGKADATMSRALRLLDLDDVEIGDDGQLSGLDEQIEEIKSDFPELFAAPAQRRTARRADAGARSGTSAPKSSSELLAAQLTR